MKIYLLIRFLITWLLPFCATVTFIIIALQEIKTLSKKNEKLSNTIDSLIMLNKQSDTVIFLKIINVSDTTKFYKIDTVKKRVNAIKNMGNFSIKDSLLTSLSLASPNIFEKYKALYFGGSKSFDSLTYEDKVGCLTTIKLNISRLNVSFNAKEIWGGDLSSSFHRSIKCPGDSHKEVSEMLSWKPRSMKIDSDSLFIDYYLNDSTKTNFYSGKFLFITSFRGKISDSNILGKVVWIDNYSSENHKLISNFNIPLQLKIER